MQKYPKSFKEELIQLYLSSKEKQTQKEFAAAHGITMDTFKNWLYFWRKKKRKEERQIVELKSTTSIPSQYPSFSMQQPTRLFLPNGMEIEVPITSIQQLCSLINGLRA